MQPEIRDLPEQKVFYVRRTGFIDGSFTQAATDAFRVLGQFMEAHNLHPKIIHCLGICPDDLPKTDPKACRYDAGFVLRDGAYANPEGEVRVQMLPAGRCAIFLHKGPYQKLHGTWSAIYGDWLPSCGVRLRDALPYEVYANDPRHTKPEDLLTEIHIPIV